MNVLEAQMVFRVGGKDSTQKKNSLEQDEGRATNDEKGEQGRREERGKRHESARGGGEKQTQPRGQPD